MMKRLTQELGISLVVGYGAKPFVLKLPGCGTMRSAFGNKRHLGTCLQRSILGKSHVGAMLFEGEMYGSNRLAFAPICIYGLHP